MSDETIIGNQDWKKKEPLMVRLYDRRDLKTGQNFGMSDGKVYGILETGSFVRLRPIEQTKKERNRLKKIARNG